MKEKKKQHILLQAPYYSQRLDVKNKFWQSRSCGIVALAMAMDFLSKSNFNRSIEVRLQLLIREGVAIGARDPKHGWIHDGLIALAQKHGFAKSFRKEFPKVRFPTSNVGSRTSDKINALRYIVALLTRGIPVLASFKKGRGGPARTNVRSGGHLVLLVGFCHLDVQRPSGVYFKLVEGFYYHDPDAKLRKDGAYCFVSTAQFLKRWKRRIMVVKK